MTRTRRSSNLNNAVSFAPSLSSANSTDVQNQSIVDSVSVAPPSEHNASVLHPASGFASTRPRRTARRAANRSTNNSTADSDARNRSQTDLDIVSSASAGGDSGLVGVAWSFWTPGAERNASIDTSFGSQTAAPSPPAQLESSAPSASAAALPNSSPEANTNPAENGDGLSPDSLEIKSDILQPDDVSDRPMVDGLPLRRPRFFSDASAAPLSGSSRSLSSVSLDSRDVVQVAPSAPTELLHGRSPQPSPSSYSHMSAADRTNTGRPYFLLVPPLPAPLPAITKLDSTSIASCASEAEVNVSRDVCPASSPSPRAPSHALDAQRLVLRNNAPSPVLGSIVLPSFTPHLGNRLHSSPDSHAATSMSAAAGSPGVQPLSTDLRFSPPVRPVSIAASCPVCGVALQRASDLMTHVRANLDTHLETLVWHSMSSQMPRGAAGSQVFLSSGRLKRKAKQPELPQQQSPEQAPDEASDKRQKSG